MMTSPESSPLTTYVLNTSDGIPATKMSMSLHRLDPPLMIWTMISIRTTDEGGCCTGLISREALTTGLYKLRFETRSYWEGLGQTSFYPYVEVVFTIHDPTQRFHLSLLMSPFSYNATCRRT